MKDDKKAKVQGDKDKDSQTDTHTQLKKRGGTRIRKKSTFKIRRRNINGKCKTTKIRRNVTKSQGTPLWFLYIKWRDY